MIIPDNSFTGTYFYPTNQQEIAVKEAVYYLRKGKKFKQFHVGQLIPQSVYDAIIAPHYEKVEEVPVETEEVISVGIEEVTDEVTTTEGESEAEVTNLSLDEQELTEEAEPIKKPRKKRQKSIIKK